MNSRLMIAFWTAGVLLVGVPGVVPAAPTTQPAAPAKMPLPSMADLQAMHDAGQYRVCLQQAVRVLNLTGDAAKPYDKFAVMLLRGDCLLHLDDSESALPVFEAAKKSPDPTQAIVASATAMLIRHSPMLAYRPKSVASEPISIVNEDSRKRAMATLLEDELKSAGPKLRTAREAANLAPILEVLPAVLDLYALEMAATGQDTRVRADLSAMGERARTLIKRELEIVDEKVLHGKVEAWESLIVRSNDVTVHAQNVLAAE